MPPSASLPDEAHLLDLIKSGLPQTANPLRVIVMGGGMAGLVAAYELKRAGHEPVLLEARSRVGGRIETIRAPFSHGLYGEAGAMRIPKGHLLTMAYIEKFGLTYSPFTTVNPNAYIFVGGRKFRVQEAREDPDCLGFNLAPAERGIPIHELWQRALAPLRDQIAAGGESAWQEVAQRHQEQSIRAFLIAQGWSEAAIELFGLLDGYESRMSASFVDILRAELGHSFTEVVRIDGGSDRLPQAFLPSLRPVIRYGAEICSFSQGAGSVTVRYRTAAGSFQETGDYAICTLPFPVLRKIEGIDGFSPGKQKAIRQLHYDRSTKIFLQSRRRFWEEDEGIRGGGSVTDLPIRNCYYPDHGTETGRGVLLASYTWADDSDTWSGMGEEERISQAIEAVAALHPQITREFEAGASKSWALDHYACGAFALFEPGQQATLYPHLIEPEGRIHFAGEHVSLNHRWIQGAIESGLAAAEAIATLATPAK